LIGGLSATLVALASACGDVSSGGAGPAPTQVKFGETALVVVVNPMINDANNKALPAPGPARGGVKLTSDDGVSATTGADGIAVLTPLAEGARTITVAGDNAGGTFTVTMTAARLREIAIATQGASAEIMVDLDYTATRTVEIAPGASAVEVNSALAVSDSVVFFHGGVYTGDLDFSGSRVTLFGEGALGGKVELRGNVTVSGSNSRIRGATITGDLVMPASGLGLSFSRVTGTTIAAGSDATFLANGLCGPESISGSGTAAVGNAGAAPSAACP
jgi:hypothetical protein